MIAISEEQPDASAIHFITIMVDFTLQEQGRTHNTHMRAWVISYENPRQKIQFFIWCKTEAENTIFIEQTWRTDRLTKLAGNRVACKGYHDKTICIKIQGHQPEMPDSVMLLLRDATYFGFHTDCLLKSIDWRFMFQNFIKIGQAV